MILLVGTEEDTTLTYFIRFLTKSNVQFLLLDQKYLLRGIDLLDNCLRVQGKLYCYDDFSGVLNRCASPDNSTTNKISSRHKNTIVYLLSLLSYKLRNVFNPPYLCTSNDSKLWQLSLLRLNIIHKIDHLVLAKVAVKERIKSYLGHETIVKSLSSIRSKVVQYEGNEQNYFLSKSDEPVLFQRLIQGDNIRVHVIVDQCFGVKIKSNAIDYRYGRSFAKFESYNIPHDVYKECIEISKQLRLRFCGIDLIKCGNKYYILEVNPSPGWSYFEKALQTRDISQKLAHELLLA